MKNPFRYFKTSPEVIRLAVMMYVRFPLSLRNVEDLLHERGIDLSHESVRFWWNGLGRCSRRKSGNAVPTGCVPGTSGNGIWTRCSCR